MINKKHFKTLSVIMATILAFSSATPVFAASSYKNSSGSVIEDISNNTKKGKDDNQKEQTKYKEYAGDSYAVTNVYVTQASTFSVMAPVVAIMNGNADSNGNYTSNIKYSVKGNIAGNETVTVEPESSFDLKQTGKEDITCNIVSKDGKSTKTKFTYGDGLRENNILSQEYTLTTKDVTAGSWTGSFSTNISISDSEKYYSSIERAVADANNLTTDNADVSISDINKAEASMFISGDEACIALMKDATEVEPLTLANDTTLDLHGNSLTLSKGNNILYNKSLTIFNGTINSTDTQRTIFSGGSNKESNTFVNDVIVNNNVTSEISSSIIGIDVSSITATFLNVTVNQTGVGNSSQNTVGIINRNTNSKSRANYYNYNYNADITNAKAVCAAQVQGNITFNKFKLVANSATGFVQGIRCASSGCLTFSAENGTIDFTTKNAGTNTSSLSYGILTKATNYNKVKNVDIKISGNKGLTRGYQASVNSAKDNTTIENVNIDVNSTTGQCIGVAFFNYNTSIINCSLTATSDTGETYGVANDTSAGPYNQLTIKDTDIDVKNNSGSKITGVLSHNNNTDILGSNITVNSENSEAYGFVSKDYNGEPYNQIDIKNTDIAVNSNSNKVIGLNSANSDIVVDKANITIDNKTSTSGFGLEVSDCNLKLTNSDVQANNQRHDAGGFGAILENYSGRSPKAYIENCNIYGKRSGLETEDNMPIEIRKSLITSTYVALGLADDANIYDTTVKLANRENYTNDNLDSGWGIITFRRKDRESNYRSTVNFYNCTLGNTKDEGKNFNSTILIGTADRCLSPVDINFYNSTLYKQVSSFFYFGSLSTSTVNAGNKRTDTVNLYDSTKLMVDKTTELSKEKISADIEWFKEPTFNYYENTFATKENGEESKFGNMISPFGLLYARIICEKGDTKSHQYDDKCGVYDNR